MSAEPQVPPVLPLDAPWFEPALARLRTAQAAGRLPQSLLLQAQAGVGGLAMARRIALLLLCEEEGAGGCGRCRGCTRVAQGQHPDLHEVLPEEGASMLKVEQVRAALAELEVTSYEGRGSVLVFDPAETMTVSAANALLKTLEEPRAGAMLILVTARPSLLPATVRSRCLRLSLRAPDREQALAWLRARDAKLPWEAALDVLGNAPYAALSSDPGALAAVRADTMQAVQDLRQGRLDVVRTAERWGRGEDFPHRLACLETWLTGLVLRACDTTGEKREMRPGAHLSGPEADINIAGALGLLDHLTEMRQQAATPLNKGLVLERFLWRLGRVATRQQSRGV